jgi:DNA polymerase III subunit epsilon
MLYRPSEQTEHPNEKACEVCGEVKPLSAYPSHSSSWDGHRKLCTHCTASQNRAKPQKPQTPVQGNSTSRQYGNFANMTPQEVARWAFSALQRPSLRIVDTETTGRGPNWGGGEDEIVEICILDANGRALLNTLVQPYDTMHPDAAKKSGITDSMLEECAPFSAIADQVRNQLNGKDVVIYNADYDEPLIAAAFTACGQAVPTYEVRCAMLAYHTFSGRHARREKWAKLDVACRAEGITNQGNAHRALGDCLSTLALLLAGLHSPHG